MLQWERFVAFFSSFSFKASRKIGFVSGLPAVCQKTTFSPFRISPCSDAKKWKLPDWIEHLLNCIGWWKIFYSRAIFFATKCELITLKQTAQQKTNIFSYWTFLQKVSVVTNVEAKGKVAEATIAFHMNRQKQEENFLYASMTQKNRSKVVGGEKRKKEEK